MDFKDQIKQLGDRVLKLKENIQTEEATKNAFIMPFLQCLGYDVFDPMEVVPEYVTDIGTKKGEKIDYAIFKDGNPIMLVECKHWAQNLDVHDGQLLRYFHVSKAKFGILTNGITYRFYTDLVEPNKMDEKPFFEFHINEMNEVQVEELKKFNKHYYDLEKIVSTASELKYTKELKSIISSELKNPSEAFVKFFVAQVYSGRATEKVMNQFTELVKKSCNQVMSDAITDRLKIALNKESEETTKSEPVHVDSQETSEKKIETTVEEMEAYMIVKAIVRKKVESNRIVYRDYQNSFSVILDDTNRKTVCKFIFNGKGKSMILVDSNTKSEVTHELKTLDDIYKYSNQIESVVDLLENKTGAIA